LRGDDRLTQVVFGLFYEFKYQHGHLMELFKGEGLNSKDLSSLQIRMLEANQVPHLLPLAIHEVDSCIRIHYPLSSKRMLSHVLKVEPFTLNHFAKLMYTIVSTLDESKNYMLNEANYVLKDHFIFIGLDWSDVYLTYVPLAMPHDEEDILPTLDKLLKKLSKHVVEAEQQAIQNWIAKSTSLQTLQAYKEAFLSLMDETLGDRDVTSSHSFSDNDKRNNSLVQPSSHNQTDDVKATASSLPKPRLPKAHLKRDTNLTALPSMSSIPNLSPHPHLQNQTNSSAPSQLPLTPLHPLRLITFKTPHQRTKWILIAAQLIFIAFLWQYYLANPSKSTLQIIAGMTLLIGDATFILLYKGIPTIPNMREARQADLAVATAVQENQPQHITLSSPSSPNSSSTSTTSATSATHANPSDMDNYYRNLSMQTTMLSPSNANATVFLGKSKLPSVGPRFEFQVEGVSNSVPITSELFTIGRWDANAKVDLELEVVGVSRIHAEIIRTSDRYELRDAGSTNGTFLNDEPLVIYQAYPLKDGDIVRIIRQEMTFRV
jgi:hypothetical protein